MIWNVYGLKTQADSSLIYDWDVVVTKIDIESNINCFYFFSQGKDSEDSDDEGKKNSKTEINWHV